MLRELWDGVPPNVKKIIISWAIVSAGLWLFKLAFGVGLLLVILFAVLAIAGATGCVREWTQKQIVGQITAMILPPIALALAPDVWKLFTQVLVERSYDSLFAFVVFLFVSLYILYVLRETVQGILKK